MTSEALLKAILSMDSYNRGYDAGIKFGELAGNNSVDSAGTQIGNVRIVTNSGIFIEEGDRKDDNIGFYALAYQMGNQTIISYRGTDYPQNDNTIPKDIYHGWTLGGGDLGSEQGEMALRFYQAVAGNGVDPMDTNIVSVGHSLGGGLAGLVAANDNHKFERIAA